MSASPARLDIVPVWARLNGMLIELVELVPDDRMRWSPKPEMWCFNRILMHLCEARQQWMNRAINDGEPDIPIAEHADNKDEIKRALGHTWQRIERTLSDQARLDATYRDRWWSGAPPYDGHWVAFHLLEHDIHHRADILLYLALLGIDAPQPSTPPV